MLRVDIHQMRLKVCIEMYIFCSFHIYSASEESMLFRHGKSPLWRFLMFCIISCLCLLRNIHV